MTTSHVRARNRRRGGLAPASWAFAGVAVVLLVILAYYLSLTTRPEISQISPAPNSSPNPGTIELSALITSQRDIDEVSLQIDNTEVQATVSQEAEQQWRVTHESVFERGERDVLLQVTDSAGRTAEHHWSFESQGDLVNPRVSIVAPPADARIPSGLGGITLNVTTFADLESVMISVNDAPVHVRIDEVTGETEYSSENGNDIFEWELTSMTSFTGGIQWIEATVVDVYGGATSIMWEIETTMVDSLVTAQFFPSTALYAEEPFLSYWREFNGQTVFGPPVSPVLQTSEGHREQFFRYAWLEEADGEIQLKLIGREIFGQPDPPASRPPGSGWRLFDPTGHYIHGTIRDFWEEHGGLQVFGYPISQEFEIERGYAQYFERAMIQVIVTEDSERVQLAPLGEELYRQLRETSPEAANER